MPLYDDELKDETPAWGFKRAFVIGAGLTLGALVVLVLASLAGSFLWLFLVRLFFGPRLLP